MAIIVALLREGRTSFSGQYYEVDDCVPQDFTIATMPARYAALGDLHAGIDDDVFDIAALLEWADRDEQAGAEVPDEPEPPD